VELVIAEKPSVARDLARVLGVRGRGDHAFEGDEYVITWCVGHLVELDEPASYDPAWKAWRLDRLPMLPETFRLRASKHARGQLAAVGKLLRDRRFTAVINACDAGREGELIFRYVYQHAHSRLPIRRLWVSSLTDDAIRRGFTRLAPGKAYDALADAARCRSEADWLVGMNATRALTARGREAGHDALYSIGRVQTPTLAMLVERERAITSFVPRDYWEVTLAADGFTARWRSGAAERLATATLADAIVARDRAEGAAIVERVTAKTSHEPPPQLFDLTSLQRTANRRFGWSAQRTLELAQALYERHKAITYPRTDARHLSSDVAADVAQPLAALADQPDYATFARPLLPTPPRLGRRFVDDTKVRDHHAIIPTATRPRALDRDEARLYDLIARRFLGAFFPDAEIALTEVWLRVGPAIGAPPSGTADRQVILDQLPPLPDRYVARGRVRVVAGWQDVAGIAPEGTRRDRGQPGQAVETGDDADAEPIGALPVLAVGQRVPARFASAAKQTTPPPRHTEATLLGAMEAAGKAIDDEALRAAMKESGLGTPATRAAIIETLLRRGYATRDRRFLAPTATGIGVIATLETLSVASLASPELTGAWEARLAKIARHEDGRDAFMTDIRRYVTAIVDAIRGRAAPPAPAPVRTNAPVDAAALPCPRCTKGTLITGSRGWGCSRWREGCGFVVWFVTGGRELTAAQLRDLVTKGKTRRAAFGAGDGRLVLDRSGPGGARFEPG
jgi:DNA topoisomerase-3